MPGSRGQERFLKEDIMAGKKKEMNHETEQGGHFVWSDRKHHLWFPISFTKYSVENGRLYTTRGFFSSREDECMLYRILDISVTRNLAQRLFGTGTIELNTKDRSNPVILLENISDPVNVKRQLSEEIENERREKGVEGKDMYGASGHYDRVEGDYPPDEDPFDDRP